VRAVAASDSRVLISHDRQTMTTHFNRFVAESPSAGLLIVSQKLDVREAIEQIILIWAASEAHEWRDQIGYIPY
jgi:hypothetical protein